MSNKKKVNYNFFNQPHKIKLSGLSLQIRVFPELLVGLVFSILGFGLCIALLYSYDKNRTISIPENPGYSFGNNNAIAILVVWLIGILLGSLFLVYSALNCVVFRKNLRFWQLCSVSPFIKILPLISLMIVVILFQTKFKKRRLTKTEFLWMCLVLFPVGVLSSIIIGILFSVVNP